MDPTLGPSDTILFYSAAAYEEDRRAAMEAGAQAYRVKPIEVHEFKKIVKELIENSERR